MTTKKKSVLGIGYLSVAMLGASLLMTNPVSADSFSYHKDQCSVLTLVDVTGECTCDDDLGFEECSEDDNQLTELKSQNGETEQITGENQESQVVLPKSIVEVGESAEDGERVLFNTKDPYHHGRDEGYIAGYQDGQKPGASENPVNPTPKPQTAPYSNEKDKNSYKSGYSDNYYSGYRHGWNDNHYIWSTLKMIWNWVTSYFY
ncbi:Uncharacterised protein [Streptococcus canis]|nr:hypothetical protein [Streptococcus canis]VTS72642.1 Uncharacterised protein [Streptococcus canis]